MLLDVQGEAVSPQSVAALSPWRFAAPLSPDMAAQMEGRSIEFDQVAAFCRMPRDAAVLLIEGAGGAMTPLTQDRTMLDLAVSLRVPVILAAGSYLGSLSHTLTLRPRYRHGGSRAARSRGKRVGGFASAARANARRTAAFSARGPPGSLPYRGWILYRSCGNMFPI